MTVFLVATAPVKIARDSARSQVLGGRPPTEDLEDAEQHGEVEDAQPPTKNPGPLLAAAHTYQRAADWYLRQPPLLDTWLGLPG